MTKIKYCRFSRRSVNVNVKNDDADEAVIYLIFIIIKNFELYLCVKGEIFFGLSLWFLYLRFDFGLCLGMVWF